MAFPMTSAREKAHTRADLQALYDLPENKDKTFELLNGAIYEVPKPKPFHNAIALRVASLLLRYADEYGLGNAFPDNTQYDLPGGDTLVPDASYVSNETLAGIPEDYHTIAPDLAVEVNSPSNEPIPTLDKVDSYLQNGTRRVWVVYPETQSINVFYAQNDGSIAFKKYRAGDFLEGEDVMPGLKIAVADIFADSSKRAR